MKAIKNLYLPLLILALLSMVSTKVYAYDIAVENEDGVTIYYNYINGGEELEVVEGSYSGSVVIPSVVTYGNRTSKVTSIGKDAFYCSNLISVTIPEGVTRIGDWAFYGSRNLISIIIPNSVTSVGIEVFSGTPWYNNQPDGLIYIGKVAYRYKGEAPPNNTIIIKNGTLVINSSCFSDCYGLTSVTIPNSVTTIGNYAFYERTGLTSINIPNSVTSIGGGAFSNCI